MLLFSVLTLHHSVTSFSRRCFKRILSIFGILRRLLANPTITISNPYGQSQKSSSIKQNLSVKLQPFGFRSPSSALPDVLPKYEWRQHHVVAVFHSTSRGRCPPPPHTQKNEWKRKKLAVIDIKAIASYTFNVWIRVSAPVLLSVWIRSDKSGCGVVPME